MARKFNDDAEKICADLIAAYSLRFRQEVLNLSSPLLRWLDFRYRFIDPQPRKILFSDRFHKKNLPHSARQALKKIVRSLKLGKDINPFQGRGLIRRCLDALAEMVCDPEGQFRVPAINDLGDGVDFSLVATPRGLAVYEANTQVAFLLPSFSGKEDSGILESIHDNILPAWAQIQLLNSVSL